MQNNLNAVFRTLVILDRDGVINHDSDAYIKNADEWQAIDGSLAAIAKLKKHHILVGLASNQSGVGKGIYNQEDLQAMHEKMCKELAGYGAKIDAYRYCLSADRNHYDYKPNPGMLLQILAELAFNLDRDLVYFVGDKISDVQAAQAAGCRPILVKTGKGLKTLAQENCQGIDIYEDLADFVDDLIILDS